MSDERTPVVFIHGLNLAGRGLSVASVAIAPAPFRGILAREVCDVSLEFVKRFA